MAARDAAREQGAGPLAGTVALSAGRQWRRVFPGEERQLGELRQWLASLLPACPARDDVASVATELAANAVLHTASGRGGRFAVELDWRGPVVRVTVADCGAPGEPRLIDDPAAEHGRGLVVVRGLSVRTGVCGDHRGRLVWADVAWADAAWDAGAAEPASPQDPEVGSSTGDSGREPPLRTGEPPRPGQALATLRAELALRDLAADDMTLTRLRGTLAPTRGPVIGYACGWFFWPSGRSSRNGRPLYAIHAGSDPAGAARRITRPP
ncbi:MAG TPA: ATP-binding protein [Streptosporangiaceae bacterium]|nr:ATP-binding protein [Streptosporangiaceae bacterium]